MVANGLAAVALLLMAWFAFAASREASDRIALAFLFLTLGLLHWLHAIALASPSMVGAPSGEAARALFSDWRIYVVEALAALAAVVYLVFYLRSMTERRIQEIDQEVAQRRSHAMQLQDGVVQGLATAQLALERGDVEMARHITAEALENAKGMLASWLPEGLEPALQDAGERS